MGWNHHNVSNWLLTRGAHLADLETLIGQLGPEMLRQGAPVLRLRLAMRTVHPLAAALSAIWHRDEGPAVPVSNPHGLEHRPDFSGSPLAMIGTTQKPLRKKLTALTTSDHIAYHEMRDLGATDYFGIPLLFGTRLSGILVVATDHPRGFDHGDLSGIQALAPFLAQLAEIHRLKILSSAVTSAYLGRGTSQRVLAGEITRGHIDQMDAAILISDIRGWTGLNARMPVEDAVALANLYFEVVDLAVSQHGGEILKFLGDGVLAIFPSEDGKQAACQNALSAAREAIAAELPEPLEFGVGLHFGRVLYGNVGSKSRLDFTVLGQAVNIAARIEALCAETGKRILYSSAIATEVSAPQTSQGRFALKGLDDPLEVFSPLN